MPIDIAALDQRVEAVFAEHTLRWRRHIHAHPDLSHEEEPTADYIEKELRRIDTEGELAIRRLLPNAVVADLRGRGGEGPRIALRADHDALPITEDSGEPFSSTKAGVMHACGHDSHTAMLMSAVVLLLPEVERLRGSVRFIFQPAEELCFDHGGAEPLIEAGVLDGVEKIFAVHMEPGKRFPTGTVAIRRGNMFHSSDAFQITLRGPGGHASAPHATVDLVALSGHLITAAQTMVTRCFAAAVAPVLTICSVHSNTNAFNVIPTQLEMKGTLRCCDNEIRDAARQTFQRVIDGIAQAFAGSVTLEFKPGVPCTVNHPDAFAVTQEALGHLFGMTDEALPQRVVVLDRAFPPSEDFALYAERVPANYSLVGCYNEAKGCEAYLHTSAFKLDEDAMKIGMRIHYGNVLTALGMV